MNDFFVIISEQGKIMKDSLGRIRFFETADEAMKVIESEYGDSKYLHPTRWLVSIRDRGLIINDDKTYISYGRNRKLFK